MYIYIYITEKQNRSRITQRNQGNKREKRRLIKKDKTKGMGEKANIAQGRTRLHDGVEGDKRSSPSLFVSSSPSFDFTYSTLLRYLVLSEVKPILQRSTMASSLMKPGCEIILWSTNSTRPQQSPSVSQPPLGLSNWN